MRSGGEFLWAAAAWEELLLHQNRHMQVVVAATLAALHCGSDLSVLSYDWKRDRDTNSK